MDEQRPESLRQLVEDSHMDPCRRCKATLKRSEMTPARIVHGNRKARGWYCDLCAPIAARLYRRGVK